MLHKRRTFLTLNSLYNAQSCTLRLIGTTTANLDAAVAAGCGTVVKPDSTMASDWIAGELGKVKLALVPDCGTIEGVRRAVGLFALPGCLCLQERPNVREGSDHAV